MYNKLPNLILGFHGCKKETFENVIYKQEQLKKSENIYDWLGHGIYFWEHNLERAKDWAEFRYGNDACVIGAVLDLGYCLNLTDSFSARILKIGYTGLKEKSEALGQEMPKNRKSLKTNDILLRDLDCAVIQMVHQINEDSNLQPYDSVRGIFIEGDPVFPGAEIREKTHVQICIRNPNCIKGYFNPLPRNSNYPMP